MGSHRAPRGQRLSRAGASDGTRRAETAVAGKRKATGSRHPHPLAKVTALPTLLGTTALVVAGAGAIALGPGHHGDDLTLSSGSSGGTDAAAGTDAIGDSRARALSRDSERQTQQKQTVQQLQAAAEQQNAVRNATLTSLAKAAEQRSGDIKKNLWILPTVGYHLTARFGQVSGLWATVHTGLDFAAPTGTPIFAIADGTITDTGWAGSYGNRTVETLDDGTQIWYAHQSAIDVKTGEHVTQGETIGAIGSTGNTTGPHVHIEVRPDGGDPVDPYPEFVKHGVTP